MFFVLKGFGGFLGFFLVFGFLVVLWFFVFVFLQLGEPSIH